MQNIDKPSPPNTCTCTTYQRVIILEISCKAHKF